MIKTYIGPFKEGVDVSVLGVSFGIVKPGESIAVPDELAEKVAWSDSIWHDGPVPTKTKKEETK